ARKKMGGKKRSSASMKIGVQCKRKTARSLRVERGNRVVGGRLPQPTARFAGGVVLRTPTPATPDEPGRGGGVAGVEPAPAGEPPEGLGCLAPVSEVQVEIQRTQLIEWGGRSDAARHAQGDHAYRAAGRGSPHRGVPPDPGASRSHRPSGGSAGEL